MSVKTRLFMSEETVTITRAEYEELQPLKKKNEELRNEASEESKMDIERLVFYRTVDRKFRFHK